MGSKVTEFVLKQDNLIIWDPSQISINLSTFWAIYLYAVFVNKCAKSYRKSTIWGSLEVFCYTEIRVIIKKHFAIWGPMVSSVTVWSPVCCEH